MYQHHNWQGALLDYPVSKVVCVGSNYAKHIKEMGSAVPEEPVLFIKPETALCDLRQPTEEHVRKAIAGYGVALDLTLRDVQGKMKKAGQPWEKAKAFDNSCPLSGFIPAAEFTGDPQNTTLGLSVNGEQRQQGTTADMIHKIVPLIAYMSKFFTLKAGDVVLTGTPDGVGPLQSGDELTVTFDGHSLTTRVL
ncbi:fumarylacetoacetate hydrolase family protein [Escherichia coli]|nr:fumarylacetoacetate hydrolase family protein [Escherichia coli]